MKCLVCEELSFNTICNSCQNTYLQPIIQKRKLLTNFYVYSFYEYEDIKELIYTKYEPIGSQIYNILAKNSFSKFAKEFNINEQITAIPIDDNPNKGYSHTAILASSLKSTFINPLYNIIRSDNDIKFANKDYSFRLQNPRNFKYKKPFLKKVNKVILIDDIVTSGLTLLEAKDCLIRENIEVLFALTLCNLQPNKGQK